MNWAALEGAEVAAVDFKSATRKTRMGNMVSYLYEIREYVRTYVKRTCEFVTNTILRFRQGNSLISRYKIIFPRLLFEIVNERAPTTYVHDIILTCSSYFFFQVV